MSYLRQWKLEQRKFSALTAYDASFAKLFSEQGVNVLLVGNSLSMTLQGHNSTLPVTVAAIAYHTRAVRQGAPACLLLADLPFMSYATLEQAFTNAAELMRAGANMVKLEGGNWLCETVKILTECAVPVCGHLGLTPQSVNVFGGYKVQGRDKQAGMQLLVLAYVPARLARQITEVPSIPVIGVGAGNATDDQILVMHDVLGIIGDHTPRFAKNFLAYSSDIRTAVRQYIQEVEQGLYPAEEHSLN
ncbi:3-methyl-2-oxobutanoate hydroxymethyltransferase [Serratia symbiotica]|nr:3-methyl-2-oxobutanoate hydroxymethyltransferase [Serratia symbiotica]